jgi:hypothetical protein
LSGQDNLKTINIELAATWKQSLEGKRTTIVARVAVTCRGMRSLDICQAAEPLALGGLNVLAPLLSNAPDLLLRLLNGFPALLRQLL